MNVIINENVEPFDVDGTLVVHENPLTIEPGEGVYVQDPVTEGQIYLRVNRPMVRLLRESFSRGAHVIVWSRGGYAWARNVILALELQDCVHQIMSKPTAYFDDTPVDKWLSYRVFIGPNEIYKQVTKQES